MLVCLDIALIKEIQSRESRLKIPGVEQLISSLILEV